MNWPENCGEAPKSWRDYRDWKREWGLEYDRNENRLSILDYEADRRCSDDLITDLLELLETNEPTIRSLGDAGVYWMKRAEKAEAEILRLRHEAVNTSAILVYYRERAEVGDAALSRMQVQPSTYPGPRNGSEHE